MTSRYTGKSGAIWEPIDVTIEPLVAHYQSGTVQSTPASEMVWWGMKTGQDSEE